MIDWTQLNDEQVVECLAAVEVSYKEFQEERGRGQGEILTRAKFNGSTALHAERFIARVKPGSPTYDVGKLEALRELLPEHDLAKACVPAHEETIKVAAKWDGKQLNRLEREYGAVVADTIADARMAGAPSVKLEEVK